MQYDPKSQTDILRFSAILIDKSLADVADIPHEVLNKKNKGQLGLLVEKYFFGLEVNNRPEPDFSEAGLELKVTGLIPKRDDELRAKERLSLTHINFHEIVHETFETSSLVRKCAKMLILCYVYDKELSEVNRVFTNNQFIYSMLSRDLEILKNDWLTIRGKVAAGLAHELSEADTVYLKASRKGQGGSKEKPVSQPNSDIKAMKRGFSLTYNYVSEQIARASKTGDIGITENRSKSFDVHEPHIPPTVEEFASAKPIDSNEELFEVTVNEFKNEMRQSSEVRTGSSLIKFTNPFDFKTNALEVLKIHVGHTTDELVALFPVNVGAKSFRFNLIVKLLEHHSISRDQLTNAEIQIKTVVLNPRGIPKEHMSFSTFKYDEVCCEDWENSTFFNEIERCFLLVVFQESADGLQTLRKVAYWNMPYNDRRFAQEVWEETQARIQNHEFVFPASSESEIAHVRPKARRSSDTVEFEGYTLRKLAFWLNKSYVASVIDNL
jgi:DNA mismatch repair protein MutH